MHAMQISMLLHDYPQIVGLKEAVTELECEPTKSN
jgi:hypothetical protein